MKKSKYGYTLSEILIALAVVGIVAAIAVPQLSNQIEKEKAGPMLGKIVNQIEMGCKNMLQADYEAQLNDARVNPSSAEVLSLMGIGYTPGGSEISFQTNFNAQNLASSVDAKFDNNNNYVFQKYQASYTLDNITLTQHDANANIAEITIDTNGTNKPNSIGKDQFKFNIRNDGRLIPADDATTKVVANDFRIKD